MKLRDHPQMTRKNGVKIWPPAWITSIRDPHKVSGEVGILEQVVKKDLFDDRVYLRIRYHHSPYVGTLQFDDPRFCFAVYTLLESHIGYSLEELGDLDLSFTL